MGISFSSYGNEKRWQKGAFSAQPPWSEPPACHAAIPGGIVSMAGGMPA